MELNQKVKIFEDSVKMYHETIELVEQMRTLAETYGKEFNEEEAKEHLEFLKRNNDLMKKELQRLLNDITV